MSSPCRAALLLFALLACRGQPPAPIDPVAPPPVAQAWPEPRTREVASAGSASKALVLRYVPAPEPSLSLELREGERTNVLWAGTVGPAQRDALWGAAWGLSVEPDGGRLAISNDAAVGYRVAFRRGEAWLFCPHTVVPASGGGPDWARMPTLRSWAIEVLETAVWGCGVGQGCKSRSLAALPVHHSEPAADALARAHAGELRAALEVAAELRPDRKLAAALLDAAVGYQAGLDEGQLRQLGALAARGLADDGPLAPEERRALRLRLALARAEVRKQPAAQLSPRISVEAAAETLEGVPTTLGGKK